MWRISSSKPKLHSNKSSLIHYLVCVPEFTDLSGNQVSLVILHLHGIDILLTQSEERKETNTLSTPKKKFNTTTARAMLQPLLLPVCIMQRLPPLSSLSAS